MLLYFILGMIFIALAIPLLESLSSIVSAWSQYIVYVFAFRIYGIKQQMGIEEDQQEEKSNPIGFQVTAIGDEMQFIEQEQDQNE